MTSTLRMVLLGSTGFIGRAVLRGARAQRSGGRVVHALVRGQADRLVGSGARAFVGSLQELPGELFFDEPHVVVHCATVQRDRTGQGFAANAAAIPALARRLPPSCRGVVYCSSASVYGQGPHLGATEEAVNPETPLAESRLATEEALRRETERRGMSLCILRPRFVIGGGDRSTLPALTRLFRRGVMVGSGAQQLSVIHVDDYAELIWAIGERMVSPDRGEQPLPPALNVAYRRPVRLAEMRAAIGQRLPLVRPWLRLPIWASMLRTLRTWPTAGVASLAVQLELTGLPQVLDVSALERAYGGSIARKDPREALAAAVAEMEDRP